MREILASGVTGILVSHSIDQVRELCNKILWLDHGRQIAFTDDVQLYCDAYEEFLATKKLPGNRQEVEQLAADFRYRQMEALRAAQRTEAQRLQEVLEAGEADAAVQAAVNVLKKNHPELLSSAAETIASGG